MLFCQHYFQNFFLFFYNIIYFIVITVYLVLIFIFVYSIKNYRNLSKSKRKTRFHAFLYNTFSQTIPVCFSMLLPQSIPDTTPETYTRSRFFCCCLSLHADVLSAAVPILQSGSNDRQLDCKMPSVLSHNIPAFAAIHG